MAAIDVTALRTDGYGVSHLTRGHVPSDGGPGVAPRLGPCHRDRPGAQLLPPRPRRGPAGLEPRWREQQHGGEGGRFPPRTVRLLFRHLPPPRRPYLPLMRAHGRDPPKEVDGELSKAGDKDRLREEIRRTRRIEEARARTMDKLVELAIERESKFGWAARRMAVRTGQPVAQLFGRERKLRRELQR